MTKKRNRAKQTTSLNERLTKFVTDLRKKTPNLEPNTEEAVQLRKKISPGEDALRLNESLTGGKCRLVGLTKILTWSADKAAGGAVLHDVTRTRWIEAIAPS
jgi:hypothetical protein